MVRGKPSGVESKLIHFYPFQGHETSSSALSWALYQLSLQPGIQDKLRSEIREAKASLAPGEHLTGDQVAALPYCDAVVVSVSLVGSPSTLSRCADVLGLALVQREVLRLCAPVAGTIRAAGKDDVIPLSQPIQLKTGETVSQLEVKKGDSFFIPMIAFNTNPNVWGEDVMSFRPERWLEKQANGLSSATGYLTYSPLLTFLAGPRGCIGYRFSVCEWHP